VKPGLVASYDIQSRNRAGLFSKEKSKGKYKQEKKEAKYDKQKEASDKVKQSNTVPKSTMFLGHLRPWRLHRVHVALTFDVIAYEATALHYMYIPSLVMIAQMVFLLEYGTYSVT